MSQQTDKAPMPVDGDKPMGFFYAVVAIALWAALPIYLKLLENLSPLEVVAHRAIWSVPVAAAVVAYRGGTKSVFSMLKAPRKILIGSITASLITMNSLAYVYAILSGNLLHASLGYYLNPIVAVGMAALFLNEKISGLRLVAVILALVAVCVLASETSGMPWIAMVIAVTWGLYAFFKKSLPLDPNQGFLLEMMIVSVPALVYVVFLEVRGEGHLFHSGNYRDPLLLILSGFTAAAPLMVYANAAKLLRLTTISILQYVGPTISFALAVFVFGENFSWTGLIAFTFIWAAVIVYVVAIWRSRRRSRG